MGTVKWDEIPEGGGKGKFFRYREKQKLRFFGQPVASARFLSGALKAEYLINALDIDGGSAQVIVTLKRSMLDALKAFNQANELDPAGTTAPAWTVTKSGSGLESRYGVMPGMVAHPLPADLDVVAAQQRLEVIAAKQTEQARAASEAAIGTLPGSEAFKRGVA